jgi:hypothetical protein
VGLTPRRNPKHLTEKTPHFDAFNPVAPPTSTETKRHRQGAQWFALRGIRGYTMAMARRGKSSIQPLWIILTLVLVVAAFAGAQLFISKTTDPFRTTQELDIRGYLDNANSLRGNVYKVEGEILNSLAWSPTGGRLISVGVDNGRETLPVLVTTNFNHLNIQKGQRFIFMLEVDDKGILRTKNLTKS